MYLLMQAVQHCLGRTPRSSKRFDPCRKSGSMHRSNYSITSSARASSVAGSPSPSDAFAVLRLITSSVFRRRLHRQVGWFLAFEDAVT